MSTATTPTLFAPPPAPPLQPPSMAETQNLAQKLRNQTAACRIRHEKLGVRKALTREQITQVAETFDANSKQITAAKKLLDTKDPAYRAVCNVRSRATHFWKFMTTPYPEPGIRLIRRDRIPDFTEKMQTFQTELEDAATKLQEKYDELRTRAQEQLGDLFNSADYPSRVDDEFALDFDFPSVEPPDYLKKLSPALYEQECQRIAARFEEAVRLTEESMATQLHKLVAHMVDRLKGEVDGKPKVFHESSVANLNEFFAMFKQVDFGSSTELAALVDRAQKAVSGVSADDIRGNAAIRNTVADQLAGVQQAMDAMMIAKPKRAISLEDDDEGSVAA